MNGEFVPLKVNSDEEVAIARRYQVRWTPKLLLLDADGTPHYESYGFLPPAEFQAMLRLARAAWLMNGRRMAEARQDLEDLVVATPQSALLPEALYWLGVARSRTKDREGAVQIRAQLKERFPGNIWTMRLPS